jgi:hypothetical protein
MTFLHITKSSSHGQVGELLKLGVTMIPRSYGCQAGLAGCDSGGKNEERMKMTLRKRQSHLSTGPMSAAKISYDDEDGGDRDGHRWRFAA